MGAIRRNLSRKPKKQYYSSSKNLNLKRNRLSRLKGKKLYRLQNLLTDGKRRTVVNIVDSLAVIQFFDFYFSTKRVFFMFSILQRYLNYFVFIFFYLGVFEPLKVKKKSQNKNNHFIF
jgi:hypothetical protein